eukprot:m.281796 g.281796  ORF g.281796 m.281796 type:complete len:169 (-) comp22894_c13_seq9:19-525(-)
MSSSLPAWAGRPALAGQRKQSTAQFVPKEARAPVSGETHSQQQFTAKQPVDPRRFPKDGAGRCTEPGVAPDVQTTARPLMKKPENSLKMTSKLHGASTLRQDFVPQTPTTTMGETMKVDRSLEDLVDRRKPPVKKTVLTSSVVHRQTTCLHPAGTKSYTLSKGLPPEE